MKTILAVLSVLFLYLVSAGIVALALSWPVMWLWNNALVGAIVGVTPISWLQALGIMILCSFLFKSSSSPSQ